jgi:pimeloyl-ACP methyl ester carboxylesterase
MIITQKSLRTEKLEIAYLESDSADGQPVVLFHGFPDCARSYSEIMVELVDRGYRAVAPFLRGFAPTRFLDETTPRAGDMAALGQDALDFFDALALTNAIVVGQDWGSSVAEILAFSRQSQVSKLVKLNWYGAYSMAEPARGFNYQQLRNSWYIWLLNTPLGEPVATFDTENFCRALWEQWSPSWGLEQLATAFEDAKASFRTPDFSKIVLNAYRSGVSGLGGDESYDKLRSVIRKTPAVSCSVIVLSGADDPVERAPLQDEAIKRYFVGGFSHKVIEGAGHFIHRQRPDEVINAIVTAIRNSKTC